ncbi:MAG: hypothetical protein EB164_06330 [Thaumarchaeota archaeon]|nr:hypothetical protein [Nitrososphaeria archaeon]NDB88528.1 hypothetical protein [Nitrososphaerota archaeon]NDB90004.1 hypothetical protein [Nitrososphaerota archaeon]NDF26529.1 hypothetical protein [Nitrosopumilaceae archaeon]
MLSKKEKPLIAFTVEKCPSCKKETKRKFKEGDCLFAPGMQCDSCKTLTSIAKIFGQAIE